MSRLLVLLALFLLGLSGSVELVHMGPTLCVAEACEDDDENGVCGSDCTDCACCVRQPTPLLATAFNLPQVIDLLELPDVESPTQSGPFVEPRKILHVPKRA